VTVPGIDITALVEAAVLVPWSHNTQPWWFRVGAQTVELHADRTRALSVNDPFDRELTISCGTALMNLLVAAWARGLDSDVAVLPDPDDADLLARVVVRPGTEPADQQLAAAIPARHTHRDRFAEGPAAQTLTAMAAACESLGVAFRLVDDGSDHDALARLVAAGDREQFANPSWRRELAAWMHPRRRGDGLTVPPVAGALTRPVVSHVDVGARTAGQDETLTREAPTLAVLTTDGDDVRDWLLAGQALQRALLVAAAGGVQAGWSNQPCPSRADGCGRTVVIRLLVTVGLCP
jgi:nitroreductase